jgi:AcrR family transcriptional regulator
MTDEPAADASSRETTTSWRELAVARSLDPARVRAEKRVQRFLDAALELMMNSSGKEFTVQDVVERSGQSLRSFYLYFAGKYELLLALFEESVRSTAAHLEQVVADDDEPLARLRRFTVEYYRLCQPSPKARSAAKAPGPAMAEFAQQLLTQHPKEASRAFVPLVEILEQLLDDAAAAGAIRSGLPHRRLAGIMLQSVMFNLFSATISGSPAGEDDGARADEYWDLVLRGITP